MRYTITNPMGDEERAEHLARLREQVEARRRALAESDSEEQGSEEEARRRRETLALQRRFLTPITLRPGDILPAEERSGEWQTKA